MATKRDARWTPVLRDKTFCSPGCGGGCLRAAFDLAHSRARALASRLGKGWTPRVWENLGWHFSAINASGKLKVHPATLGHWTAYLGEAEAGGRWAECAMSRDVEVLRRLRDESGDGWTTYGTGQVRSLEAAETNDALTAAIAALEAVPALKARITALEKELDDPTEYGP